LEGCSCSYAVCSCCSYVSWFVRDKKRPICVQTGVSFCGQTLPVTGSVCRYRIRCQPVAHCDVSGKGLEDPLIFLRLAPDTGSAATQTLCTPALLEDLLEPATGLLHCAVGAGVDTSQLVEGTSRRGWRRCCDRPRYTTGVCWRRDRCSIYDARTLVASSLQPVWSRRPSKQCKFICIETLCLAPYFAL
jgi:hypothetical protein